MLHFKKIIKKNTCRYHYQNLKWYNLQFLRYRGKHTEIGNFRSHHFTRVYRKWQSYDVWSLRYGVQRTEFFVNPPPVHQSKKSKKFLKMEKLPGGIIILHSCDINGNHMMYGSWDIEHIGQNCLPFWTIFCTFTSLTTPKIKIFENNE